MLARLLQPEDVSARTIIKLPGYLCCFCSQTDSFSIFQISLNRGNDNSCFDCKKLDTYQRNSHQASTTTPLSRIRSITSTRLDEPIVFSTAMMVSSCVFSHHRLMKRGTVCLSIYFYTSCASAFR